MPSEPKKLPEAGAVEQWIVQARAGSSDALGRLLHAGRRYLLHVANRELSPLIRAKVAASDIVQDTMLEAGRDFPRFRGETEEELRGWLQRMLRNNVANVYRHFNAEKRQVDREISLEDGAAEALLADALHQNETPSVQVQAREQDEQLERAMQLLPEHSRQILLLHTLEGLTFVQIAERMGDTADGIRKAWGRALEELAKLLESPHESA